MDVDGDFTTYIDNSTHATNHYGPYGLQLVAGSKRMVVGRIPRPAKHFIARAQVAQLRKMLEQLPVAVVVTGMRGAGKTQVAAAYAREALTAEGGLVGWVNAETRDTLLAGLGEIAARVGVADPDGDSAKSAQRLRDHLSERQEPALLVLDNATDPDFVDTLLPTGNMTRVVVTSTDRAFTQLGEMIDADEGFSRPESVRYLGAATGLDDPVGAALVAADLGDLPLALSAAAATIAGRHLDYPRYRQLLAAQPLPAVLPRRKGNDHPLTVDQALLLSIRTVEAPTDDPELDAVVRWLLGVMAMLAPDGVDYTMLPDRAGRLDAALQRCVEGSLLSWSVVGRVVVMHPLLARVVRERAHITHTTTEVTAAIAVITPLLFPENQAFQRRAEGARLVDHIEALWKAIGRDPTLDAEALLQVLAARRWATRQLTKAADTVRSIGLAHHSLTDHEHILGADHPGTLTARNDLADAYQEAGQLDRAVALFERNLADRERLLGIDHADAVASRGNLACAYESAGRWVEAIGLYERVLAERERMLGADHPKTLTTRNDLADAYREAGRLAEAITMHEQAVADRERVQGADHPDTLLSRNQLAYAYGLAGQLTEAVSLFERTLTDRQRVQGADHPDTLKSRHNLASTYEAAGRSAEAIDLHERTLSDRERILGTDHPKTLLSRHSLARAYKAAGRLPEAIGLYERNRADRERILSPDHPDTLVSRHSLADAYREAGRQGDAIALYEKLLADYERVLGPDHPTTRVVRDDLRSAHQKDGGARTGSELIAGAPPDESRPPH